MITTVYAAAFRHKTPGEGVGGCEWDVEPGSAIARVLEILGGDPDYETTKSTIEVEPFALPLDDETRRRVTYEVDAYFWSEWQ